MAQVARKYVKQTQVETVNQSQNTATALEIQKKKFKRRERLTICGSFAWIAVLGCLTIASSTNVNTAQNKLQDITTEISNMSSKNSNIKQEVSELSSRSRLTGIAKKDGLSLDEQNTRNVTK
ncbi:cell division protein FtsL [Ligilactobacillus cholophilus]|uniref:cell division protein FtsL n=1 Tax=Ligilactobacillus cholophilus TaxID=3050131 RepID=UPI0025AFD641|nr:cell division protein FtsL [Ligilactobacillus cholophilus]